VEQTVLLHSNMFYTMFCMQAGGRYPEYSGELSPPIGFTLSMEPSSVSRQSSAAEPVSATYSAKVLGAVC